MLLHSLSEAYRSVYSAPMGVDLTDRTSVVPPGAPRGTLTLLRLTFSSQLGSQRNIARYWDAVYLRLRKLKFHREIFNFGSLSLMYVSWRAALLNPSSYCTCARSTSAFLMMQLARISVYQSTFSQNLVY